MRTYLQCDVCRSLHRYVLWWFTIYVYSLNTLVDDPDLTDGPDSLGLPLASQAYSVGDFFFGRGDLASPF